MAEDSREIPYINNPTHATDAKVGPFLASLNDFTSQFGVNKNSSMGKKPDSALLALINGNPKLLEELLERRVRIQNADGTETQTHLLAILKQQADEEKPGARWVYAQIMQIPKVHDYLIGAIADDKVMMPSGGRTFGSRFIDERDARALDAMLSKDRKTGYFSPLFATLPDDKMPRLASLYHGKSALPAELLQVAETRALLEGYLVLKMRGDTEKVGSGIIGGAEEDKTKEFMPVITGRRVPIDLATAYATGEIPPRPGTKFSPDQKRTFTVTKSLYFPAEKTLPDFLKEADASLRTLVISGKDEKEAVRQILREQKKALEERANANGISPEILKKLEMHVLKYQNIFSAPKPLNYGPFTPEPLKDHKPSPNLPPQENPLGKLPGDAMQQALAQYQEGNSLPLGNSSKHGLPLLPQADRQLT